MIAEPEYTTPQIEDKEVTFKIKNGKSTWVPVRITEEEINIWGANKKIHEAVKEGGEVNGIEIKRIVEILKREKIYHPRIFIGAHGHEYALTMINNLDKLLDFRWERVMKDIIFRKIAYMYFATNYGKEWLNEIKNREKYAKNLLKDYLRALIEKVMYYPPNRDKKVLKAYEKIEGEDYYLNLLDINNTRDYSDTKNVRVAYTQDQFVVIMRGTNVENIMNALDVVGKDMFSKLTVRNMKEMVAGKDYYRLFVIRSNVLEKDAPFFKEYRVEDSSWEYGIVKREIDIIMGKEEEKEVWDFEL